LSSHFLDHFSYAFSNFQIKPSKLSKIQLKSGNITYKVGKSVSLLTISSICLVTQSIKKSGNGIILVIFNFIASWKLKDFKASRSKSTEISHIESAPSKALIKGQLKPKVEGVQLATCDNEFFILSIKELLATQVFL
jgi:hypothetical protein